MSYLYLGHLYGKTQQYYHALCPQHGEKIVCIVSIGLEQFQVYIMTEKRRLSSELLDETNPC